MCTHLPSYILTTRYIYTKPFTRQWLGVLSVMLPQWVIITKLRFYGIAKNDILVYFIKQHLGITKYT